MRAIDVLSHINLQRLGVKMSKKLRRMSATVERVESITVELANGERVTLENADVLTSYSSRVAIYCKMRVYLLPRYDYSVTTLRHVHAFIQDYCSFVRDYDVKTIRNIAANGLNGGEYMFANGIVGAYTKYSGNVERY